MINAFSQSIYKLAMQIYLFCLTDSDMSHILSYLDYFKSSLSIGWAAKQKIMEQSIFDSAREINNCSI